MRRLNMTRGFNRDNVHDMGGGIRITEGSLTLEWCHVFGCRALHDSAAGIGNNYGDLIVRDSVLSDNYAHAGSGGAIVPNGGLVFQRSTIVNNGASYGTGGVSVGATHHMIIGISSRGDGSLGVPRNPDSHTHQTGVLIEDTLIADNDATTSSIGGLSLGAIRNVTLIRVTIEKNRAGNSIGGVQARGPMHMRVIDSIIRDNSAGNSFGGLLDRGSPGAHSGDNCERHDNAAFRSG